MPAINFSAKLSQIKDLIILKVPKDASQKLPSRGIALVKGTANNYPFELVLEPDGKGSHWFKFDEAMLKGTKSKVGDTVSVEMETIKDWPEPEIPEDLNKALKTTPEAFATWMNITPMSRWDWIRWINSTKNPETRKIRIEKTFSKFKDGIRRPCCFNRTECTDPSVSSKGVLLDIS